MDLLWIFSNIYSLDSTDGFNGQNHSRLVLTVNDEGRLGNNMCQYAHLYLLGTYPDVQVMDEELNSYTHMLLT